MTEKTRSGGDGAGFQKLAAIDGGIFHKRISVQQTPRWYRDFRAPASAERGVSSESGLAIAAPAKSPDFPGQFDGFFAEPTSRCYRRHLGLLLRLQQRPEDGGKFGVTGGVGADARNVIVGSVVGFCL
jgi:hypothetical protein